ncbi:type II toxin-antitoxin system HicA family toxin [Methylotuvimicrobium buryatense]
MTGCWSLPCESNLRQTQFAKILENQGWHCVRVNGSHHVYMKPGNPARISSNSQFGDQKGCGVCLARMSAAGSCRQAPMDGFTAFLDRHTPHPKIGETAQTGNCCRISLPIHGNEDLKIGLL